MASHVSDALAAHRGSLSRLAAVHKYSSSSSSELESRPSSSQSVGAGGSIVVALSPPAPIGRPLDPAGSPSYASCHTGPRRVISQQPPAISARFGNPTWHRRPPPPPKSRIALQPQHAPLNALLKPHES